MATLDGKKTNGQPAWEFYVEKNPEWKTLKLQIEKGIKSAVLYAKKGNGITIVDTTLKEGTELTLTSNKALTFDKIKYAQVKTKAKSGLVPIKQIRKPTKAGSVGTTGDEEKAIESLNNLIKSHGYPINIIVKDSKNRVVFKLKNIIGCKKTPGTPKSDFSLFDKDKKDVFWISHKAAGGAKAFQQYSGVTQSAGEVIFVHKQVQKFMKAVAGNIKSQKLTNPMQMTGLDKNLINYSIFGPDFGKDFGIDHVNIIGQGDPILKPAGADTFELQWSDHWSCSGDLSHFIGDYTPVLGATFREGRGFETKEGVRYIGARIGIYPMTLMKRGGLVTIKG